MKKFYLLPLILIPLTAQARWTSMSFISKEGNPYNYDEASVVKEGPIASVWILETILHPIEGLPKEAIQVKKHAVIDCSNKLIKTTEGILELLPTQAVHTRRIDVPNAKWQDVEFNTLGSELYSTICK